MSAPRRDARRTTVVVALALGLAAPPVLADGPDSYFPLEAGNWWAYEERDEQGLRLSRETWTLDVQEGRHPGELHLRAATKRLDALGDMRRRWESHEYLRVTAEGLHKRYPASGSSDVEVLLWKEPARAGTTWRDAQGRCEVAEQGGSCRGPRGVLADCMIVVCRLGEPAATVVTSTYARGVGMVRQDIEVTQLLPSLAGPVNGLLPQDATHGGRSLLQLIGYHVASQLR